MQDVWCNRNLWGAFLILIGVVWALSLAGIIEFAFWPYIGAAAMVFAGIGMLRGQYHAG